MCSLDGTVPAHATQATELVETTMPVRCISCRIGSLQPYEGIVSCCSAYILFFAKVSFIVLLRSASTLYNDL